MHNGRITKVEGGDHVRKEKGNEKSWAMGVEGELARSMKEYEWVGKKKKDGAGAGYKGNKAYKGEC